MADPTYTPPEVWTHDAENGGRFASINRPTAGAREEKDLPRGKHPFQLYSLATPNGVKATIMFEELLEKGHTGAEYDAYTVNIGEGTQFTSGFVEINPNSKIPALLDASGERDTAAMEECVRRWRRRLQGNRWRYGRLASVDRAILGAYCWGHFDATRGRRVRHRHGC